MSTSTSKGPKKSKAPASKAEGANANGEHPSANGTPEHPPVETRDAPAGSEHEHPANPAPSAETLDTLAARITAREQKAGRDLLEHAPQQGRIC